MFKNLPHPLRRPRFLYRCNVCKHEEWYTIELPKNLAKCNNLVLGLEHGTYRECRGPIVVIESTAYMIEFLDRMNQYLEKEAYSKPGNKLNKTMAALEAKGLTLEVEQGPDLSNQKIIFQWKDWTVVVCEETHALKGDMKVSCPPG